MLREQAATDASSAVRTRSRIGLELRGLVLVHALHTSASTNNADLPLFVSRALPNERPGGSTMSMRQTTLGFGMTAADILGADFTGDLDVDFFGGQFGSSGGRHFPLMRLRTASATLKWDRFSLMAGQEQPLITDVDPISLASVGTPGFTAAGNLWLWLPQIRAGFESEGNVGFSVRGAVLAPVVSGAIGTFSTVFDAAERSRWPSLEAKLGVDWGEEERWGEVTVGIHHGRVLTQADTVELTSSAVAMTALVPFAKYFELRGEFYDGQLVNGLGGGAIGQSISDSGEEVESMGGWAQLNVRPNLRWTLGIGAGYDEPELADVPAATGRRRNETQAVHAQWTPAGPIIVGLEWRKIATTYAAGVRRADHINLALGFTF